MLNGRIPGTTIDKVSLWNLVLDELCDQIDNGLYFQLKENSYLDSVEMGQAIVAISGSSLLESCQGKAWLAKKCETAINDSINMPVQVTFAASNGRIYKDTPRPTVMPHQNQHQIDSAELQQLHTDYGDVMGIVDNHPVFRTASLPLPKGGWGIFTELLTDLCRDYGVMTVLNGLRDTAKRTNIKNPRAFFLSALERGDYGYKLAYSQDMLGHC